MPPTNNVRQSLLDVSRKKITNPHAPAAYNVSRAAIDAYPSGVVQFSAQVISIKGTPVTAAGRTGSWIIAAGTGGTLSSSTGTTNAQGIATVNLTVGTVVGTVYRVKFIDSEQLTGTSPSLTVIAVPIVVPPPVDPPPTPAPSAVLTTIQLTPSSSTLEVGQRQTLSIIGRDQFGNGFALPALTANIGNPSLLSAGSVVSSQIIVTALAAGSTTLSVTGSSVTSNDVAFSVTPPIVVVPPPIVVPPPPPPDPVINPPAITDATLPAVTLNTALSNTPSNGSTITLSNGGNVQAALNAAVPGDTIVIDRGAILPGSGFFLPAKTGGIAGEWITVKLAPGSFVAEGTRLTAADAATYNLPKLRLNAFGPLLYTQPGAAKWRFIGIEIDVATSVTACTGIVLLGDASAAQNSLATVPTDIIFDRCYVHGHSTLDAKRAFAFDSARTAFIDGTILEIHSAADAQGISGTNGPGPFKIHNSRIQASAEGIAFGGSDPGIAGLVPSDVTITHNHIAPDPAWKGLGWVLKNLIEFKSCRRALIEGNLGENGIPHGQTGYAVVLQSNNAQGTSPTSITEHVTIRYNVWRNCASWFQLNAHDYPTDRPPAPNANHITIRHNVGIGLDNPAISVAQGRLFTIVDQIHQLTIEHNTGFYQAAGGSCFIWSGEKPLNDNIIRNNLVGGGGIYQIYAQGLNGKPGWDLEAGPGSLFLGNVVLGFGGAPFIPGNYNPGAADDIGFVGGGAAAFSLTATLADLTLSGGSPYKNAGTDSTDIGANMTLVAAAVAGVGGGF